MTFAHPLPWWALLLVVVGAALVAWQAYRRFEAVPARRYALSGLRLVTLLAIVLILMRPVQRSTDIDARDAVVPILVDTSRSMGIEDADGETRIARAKALVSGELLPALQGRFATELLAFGESVAPATPEALGSAARRSDLMGALAAVRERYRGRAIAGVVVISDGGDTGSLNERPRMDPVAPVYAFGIGAEEIGFDREVLSVTAAEAVLDESRVDLAVSAVAHGTGSDPIELRLLENGRSIDVRRVTPHGGRWTRSSRVPGRAGQRRRPPSTPSKFPADRGRWCPRTTRGASSCSRRPGSAVCCSSKGHQDTNTAS